MNEFQELLRLFLADFEPYSRRCFSKKVKEIGYPDLIRDFYVNLEDFGRGGKALRPFLVYLAYRASGGKDLKKLLPICLAFELIHSFCLIQDDIIDKSDIRRGKLTIHKRYEKRFGVHYGISQAIMTSDIACFEAFQLFSGADFDEQLKRRVFEKFIKILLETVYGQSLDVEYTYKKAGLSQIRQVVDLKTARYSFVGPLTIGAMLAGAKNIRIRALTDFGLNVGVAFQLRDDVLGVFGNEQILGKSVLSDLREGKNTILTYKVRKMVKGEELSIIERIWGKSDATFGDLEQVRKVIKNCGVLGWSFGEQTKLVDSAKKQIGIITRDRKMQEVFNEVADFAINREK